MRPKIVITVLIVALGLLGLMALVSKSPWSKPAVTPGAIPATRTASVSANETRGIKPALTSTAAADAAITLTASPRVEPKAYVQQRIAELNDLATQDDPAAHATMLAELTNQEKDIRQAAREAVMQTHDPADVPRLHEVLAITEDREERIALQKAIKFLNLPSLTDYLAAQGQNQAGDSGNTDTAAMSARQKFKARRNRLP